MEYALTADHHRVHAFDAEKGQEYYCPVCGNQVIPRQGEVNSWHFAHVTSCIHVYITFQKANNKFEYYIANNTTGKSASGYVELDASKQFDGTTVEWVVERCKSGGSLTSLGDYGTMTMKNCKATLNSSNTWLNLGNL